tara:strand:+ start:3152 stop:4024 length:873 start_codon:yes stop_codon:yes gene_type:complete
MKILPINNTDDLNELINFLAGGFKWSLRKKEKIQKSLILQNKYLKNYGYYIFENNRILGGFLIFHQGYIPFNKNLLKIINISSWYFIPNSRGGLPLIMIKKVIENNHNSIITNFTPTFTAQKILKPFGFRENNIFNLKNNIFYLSMKNLSEIYKFKKIKVLKNDLRRIRIRKNYFLNNSKQIDIKIGKLILSILFAETYFERNLKISNIRLKGIRILWTSDYELYSKYFFQINLFLLIKNKSWFCTTHCKLSTTFKHTKNNNKQLILIPKDFDTKKISSILSLGSELNFI